MTEIGSDPWFLVIGDVHRHEFRAFVDWMQQHRFVHANSVADALKQFQTMVRPPQVVYWLQSYPGQHTDVDVQALRRASVTTELVCIYGAFCEGETRTGKPMSPMPRLAWHAWRPFVQPRQEADGSGKALIGIATASDAAAELLDVACRDWGHETCRLDWTQATQTECQLVLWEDDADGRRLPVSLSELDCRFPGIPIVGIVGFPRIQLFQELSQGRLAAVLPKPFELSDLRFHLERLGTMAEGGLREARQA